MPVDESQTSEVTSGSDAPLDDAQSDVDVEAIKAAIGSASEQAQIASELANLKRAAGHVPELQKRFAAVEKAISRLDGIEQSTRSLQERIDVLISAFPEGLIPERTIAGLRQAPDPNATVLAKLAELEARLATAAQPAEEDEDPTMAARRAELNAAQESVNEYAARFNFDPASIPDAVYGRALAAHGNDAATAVLDVIKYIDQQVAAAARRGERKDAGSGGTVNRSSRSGPVTLEMMKSMSVEEVMKIPAAERYAALQGSN